MRICERWDLPEPKVTEGWFADWAQRRRSEVSVHLTCGYLALQTLQWLDPEYIHEPFGGLGAQAHMIDELWPQATWHGVSEYSVAGAAYLRAVLPSNITVMNTDSYEDYYFADLYVADFGDLTVLRMEQDAPRRGLLNHMFTMNPKAVVLTDIAGPRLHLVGKSYTPIIGEFDTHEDYLRGVGRYVAEQWGYYPYETYYHRWSSVTTYLPEERGHNLTPVYPTTYPIGLTL